MLVETGKQSDFSTNTLNCSQIKDEDKTFNKFNKLIIFCFDSKI